jgi:RNA polymerase sigma-70 factor, ECF subfamily
MARVPSAPRATRNGAVTRLHALLRAARFEVARRRPTLPHLRGNELDEIAPEAADDALIQAAQARLARSRASARAQTWNMFSSARLEPEAEVEQKELLSTVQSAIAEVLTPHQRRVLVALGLNGVPIEVFAERLSTTHWPCTRRSTTRGRSCAGTSRAAAFPRTSSTATSSSRSPGRMPTQRSRGCERISTAVRPVARSTRVSARSSAASSDKRRSRLCSSARSHVLLRANGLRRSPWVPQRVRMTAPARRMERGGPDGWC